MPYLSRVSDPFFGYRLDTTWIPLRTGLDFSTKLPIHRAIYLYLTSLYLPKTLKKIFFYKLPQNIGKDYVTE